MICKKIYTFAAKYTYSNLEHGGKWGTEESVGVETQRASIWPASNSITH